MRFWRGGFGLNSYYEQTLTAHLSATLRKAGAGVITSTSHVLMWDLFGKPLEYPVYAGFRLSDEG
jgi:hypothetical protein